MSYKSNKKIKNLLNYFNGYELKEALSRAVLSDNNSLCSDILKKLSSQEKLEFFDQINLNIEKSQMIQYLLITKALVAINFLTNIINEDVFPIKTEELKKNTEFQKKLTHKIALINEKITNEYQNTDEFEKIEAFFDYWILNYEEVRKLKKNNSNRCYHKANANK